jgi:hypothetical protein
MEYNHTIGMYVRWNKKDQLEVRVAPGVWRRYTPAERAAPVVDWLRRQQAERDQDDK